MKDIEFRAWLPELNIMIDNVTVYGNNEAVLETIGIDLDIFCNAVKSKNKDWHIQDDGVYLETENDYENIYDFMSGDDWVYLTNYKLMQYTGLKDKNGVKIFEGDIVHIKKNKFGEGKHEVWSVEYDQNEARFVVYNQLNSIRNIEFDEGCIIVNVCSGYEFIPEVIGNIHQNPELI